MPGPACFLLAAGLRRLLWSWCVFGAWARKKLHDHVL